MFELLLRPVYSLVPHVLQPVHRQEVGGHGEVQLVDQRCGFRRRVQQVDDGAAQVVQLSLKTPQQQYEPLNHMLAS